MKCLQRTCHSPRPDFLKELKSLSLERDLAAGFDQFAELVVRFFAPGLTLRGAKAGALARAGGRIGLAAREAPSRMVR